MSDALSLIWLVVSAEVMHRPRAVTAFSLPL